MEYDVGLDVSLKQTAICVVDGDCRVVWRGCADTHPEMILNALDRWVGRIARHRLETGSITPWLARELKARGLPVVVMDARRASDALDAYAHSESLLVARGRRLAAAGFRPAYRRLTDARG